MSTERVDEPAVLGGVPASELEFPLSEHVGFLQPTSPAYPAAASRRAKTLAFEADDLGDGARREAIRPRRAGVMWHVTGRDGVMLAVRAWDLAGLRAAQRDVRRLARLDGQLYLVPVRDAATGNVSWWMTHKNEVLLVSAHAWAPSVWRSGRGLASARKTLRLIGRAGTAD